MSFSAISKDSMSYVKNLKSKETCFHQKVTRCKYDKKSKNLDDLLKTNWYELQQTWSK